MRFLVLLLFAAAVNGQTLVEAPKPKVADKKFWLVMAGLGAAKAADAITTERFVGRGCVETSVWRGVTGPRPGPGKMAALAGASFAGEALTAYFLKRALRKHPRLKWVWMIEPMVQGEEHARAAYLNEGLVCR